MDERPRMALATRNRGKIRELVRICAGWPVRWTTYDDPDTDRTAWPDVAEDADTYVDNALAKARAVAEALGMAAVADDSGIEVDVLGGAPGPASAHFAGERATERENLDLLIERIRSAEPGHRTARYRCIAACVG